MKKALVLIVCILLSGCGFHLRGTTHAQNLPFDQLEVIPHSKEPFARQLNVVLDALKVEQKESASWQLQLSPLKQKTFPMAYGPNGELVREKIQLSLKYKLLHNQEVILDKVIVNDRQHQLNIATKLADQAELEVILHEMEQDLIQQLIIQMSRV